MLTTEQVKKIAEHMPFEIKPKYDYKLLHYYDADTDRFTLFKPLEDRDNHKVFKSLVDECKKRKLKIIIEDGEIFINKIVGEPFFYSPKFNNENICLAYLAVME